MSRRPRLSAATAIISLLCATAGVAGVGSAARAAQGGGVRLQLVDQPVAHSPDDPLALEIKVFNDTSEPLGGFAVTVGVAERVLSRSALQDALENLPEFRPSAFTRYFEDRQVPAGESTTVLIRDSVSELSTLEQATEGGAYPLTVELFDGGLTQRLDHLTTPLIYYPTPPEDPLKLVLVQPINALPARAPDGTFPAGPAGKSPLEEAVHRSGWLAGAVRVIRRLTASDRPQPDPRPGLGTPERNRPSPGKTPRSALPPEPEPLEIAVAPTPRLIEELADMSNGYRRTGDAGAQQLGAGTGGARAAGAVLKRLSSLLRRDGVQPLLVPYSRADLPSIEGTGPGSSPGQTQLGVGEGVLDEELGYDFGHKWLLPPGGRIDTATLQELQLANAADRLFFSTRSLQGGSELLGEGCSEAFATFTCPVRARTVAGEALGFVADRGLEERLGELARQPEIDRLALQKVLAETATIWAELPGRPERVVQATIPPLWHPPPRSMHRLLAAFASAPWLDTVTPARGLSVAPPSEKATVPEIGTPPGQVGSDYAAILANAHDTVQSFSSLEPPEAMVERLDRNILVAQSQMWWADEVLAQRGLSYAVEASREAYAEMAKVRLGAPDRITLTAREGQIRLEAFNDAAYPVKVKITFAAPKLSIEESIVRTIPPGKQQPLEVEATAEASGTSSLEVYLQSPDGLTLPGSQRRIAVTSTQFNRIALGLTVGALAFLVLFYINRAIVRRRGARPSAQTTAT